MTTESPQRRCNDLEDGRRLGELWYLFGAGNVMIWRTMLAVESGGGSRLRKIASSLALTRCPVRWRGRHATPRSAGVSLWSAAPTERRADEAVRAHQTARELAPSASEGEPVDPGLGEGMLTRARRDVAGRESRDMAHWLGIATATNHQDPDRWVANPKPVNQSRTVNSSLNHAHAGCRGFVAEYLRSAQNTHSEDQGPAGSCPDGCRADAGPRRPS